MKPSLLFPPLFKIIGFILLVPGLVLGYLFTFNNYVLPFLSYGRPRPRHTDFEWTGHNNLTDELVTTLVIIGLLFIGFSKLKNEIGVTKKLRQNALYWAVLADAFMAAVVLITGALGNLLNVPLIQQSDAPYFFILNYNPIILLLIFIARFYYLLGSAKAGRPVVANYLIRNKPFNMAGKITTALFIVLLIAAVVFKFILSPAALVIFLPCLLLWISSKEKNENDQTNKIRLRAMQVSVYASYTFYILATWLIYGLNYWGILPALQDQ
jgi:hypothetical protein